MSANAWAKIITKSIRLKEDVVPKGFYPRREIEKIWNVSKGETNARLRDLMDQNLIETKYFKIKDSRGICRIQHYRIK